MENESPDGARSLRTALHGPAPVHLDFLASILDSIDLPILVKDRQFRVVMINRAWCEMTRHAPDDVLGKTDFDLVPAAEAARFRAIDEQVFARGDAVHFDRETLFDGRGEAHVVGSSRVPLRDAEGAVTHIVGIVREITPILRAQEVLQRSNEDLERRIVERSAALAQAQAELLRRERLAVIGQLAGGIAHQIRNPLGSIKNAAYLIQMVAAAQHDPDLTRALAIIHEEVRRANQIITDLLDYARVAAPSLRHTPVDYLAEQAVASLDVAPGIRVVREIAADLAPVNVDPVQVQRALSNLVRNALQAMGAEGTLSLRAARDGEMVELEVSDTGQGIPDDVRRRLFEPAVSTHPGAFGMGLITAKALIENQGGTVSCASTDNRGTTFVVRLPVARDDAA